MTPQSTDLFGAPVRSFEQDAEGFLIAYARKCKGQSFSAEDVTTAALAAGSYFMADFDIYIRAGNLWRGQGILWPSGLATVIADGNGTWTNAISQAFGVFIQFSVASAGNIVSPLSCNVQTLYQTL